VSAQANDGSSPIMFAAQHGHDDVVIALLRAGADPDAEGAHGFSAVRLAQQNEHKRTLSLLLGAARANLTSGSNWLAAPPMLSPAIVALAAYPQRVRCNGA
jgi:ankyrin repeat protein